MFHGCENERVGGEEYSEAYGERGDYDGWLSWNPAVIPTEEDPFLDNQVNVEMHQHTEQTDLKMPGMGKFMIDLRSIEMERDYES